MAYLKLILIAAYSVSIATYCISALRDITSVKHPKTILEWYSAIILPVASILGGVFHYFDLHLNFVLWYICLAVWITAIIAFVFELRDLQDLDERPTLGTVLFGLLLIGIFFGPGLFLAGAWLFGSVE